MLSDVAQLAGVSISTVSRVLTGRTPVSPRLRDKVQAAVSELGYRPNAAAQTLVSGRRSTVAVLARNTLRYGYAATLQGIEEAARAAGYVVSIAVVESEAPRDLDRAVDLVLSQSLAGAIVVEFDSLGVRTLESLPDALPVVAAAGARTRSSTTRRGARRRRATSWGWGTAPCTMWRSRRHVRAAVEPGAGAVRSRARASSGPT